jgi:uncharacterized protein (TIGR03083 family)
MHPILTAHLFAPLHYELMSLLRRIRDEEWSTPTAAGSWTVKDLTAHLLDTALRRLSEVPIQDFEPNAANRDWIVAMQRISPRILVELMDRYGAEQAAYLASLDPFAKAMWGVTWAGEDESPVWFDVARELTERWHHQQQIRDALGRPPLFEPFLRPVIETFVRGVPHAYRGFEAAEGTSVALRINDSWTVRREEREWTLFSGEDLDAAVVITIDPDSAWRLFTKGRAQHEPRVEGDRRLAEPLLKMICVIG